MDFAKTMNGDLTLQQTEQFCESTQFGGFKLDSILHGTIYEGGAVRLVNNASYDLANSSSILTNLGFRELGAGDAEVLKADMKTQGWVFICDSSIYVQDQLKRVLVFGRNN